MLSIYYPRPNGRGVTFSSFMLVLDVVLRFLPREPQGSLPQILPVSALKALSVGNDVLYSTPASAWAKQCREELRDTI